jgi:hypothetical protein
VPPQAQNAAAALDYSGFRLFTSLVKCARVDKAAADPKLKVTVFAPTDAVSPMCCIVVYPGCVNGRPTFFRMCSHGIAEFPELRVLVA